MRSRELRWLVAKDVRTLLSSRSYGLLLLSTGLLVGQAFITAVETYAEMSGANGGPAALAEGLTPLEGIVAPTFGALSLAATLLLPFVVIRLIAHERQTGAWKLLVQGPATESMLLVSKLGVLLAGWCLAWVPAFLAMILWALAGNHLYLPEIGSVILGHALFAWVTIGVAVAAAAITATEATAAIVTLGFTIGTWALDFLGAARGGTIAQLARFTPTSALRSFEHGLIETSVVGVMLVAGALGIAIGVAWLSPGRGLIWRWCVGAVLLLLAVGGGAQSMRLRGAHDVSENRQNSFAAADEAALRQIHDPLHVEVHLAQEDPRLADLRRGVLEKLQRILPVVRIDYIARSRTGMFEQADAQYGESWYSLGTKRAMTHSATASIVLETIYGLAGITPPTATESTYPGYPIERAPRGMTIWFFVVWPLLVLGGLIAASPWLVDRRRRLRLLRGKTRASS